MAQTSSNPPEVHSSTSRWVPDVIDLDHGEQDELNRLAAQVTASPSGTPELFCHQAQRAASRLPERLTDLLVDFKRSSTASGAILINGLSPEESLVPTPPDNRRHAGEHTQTARVQAVINHAYGQMIAYEVEGYGRLYQDVIPNRLLANTQTSQGSGAELELHTEQAFSSLRPDALSLACLRGDPDASTNILPAYLLIEKLTPFERHLLQKPLWMTSVDHSCRIAGHNFTHGLERGPLAIVSGFDDDPTIVFDQDLMRGITEDAQKIVTRIVEVYRNHHFSYPLMPGQLLLIDNLRALHGRSGFTPKYDGSDRFVLRTFIVHDLELSRHARPWNGRTVSAQFS